MTHSAEIYTSFDLTPFENPLSDGGRWESYSTRPPLQASSTGNSIHGTVEFAVNGSAYMERAFNGDIVEAYGCTPASGLGAALESHRIVALFGDVDSYNGYSSGYGGGIGSFFFFRRYDNGSFTDLGLITSGPPDRLGIRITPTHVQQWASLGGDFVLIQEFPDTAHRGPIHFALETEEQGGLEEVNWQCFAAGVVNRSQIYRILRGVA